jgi:hypothetical protein
MTEISLRGLEEVLGDVYDNIFTEVSSVFEEAPSEDWSFYDTITPA